MESATETRVKENDKMVVKRCFERIINKIVCKSYIKNEDIPENKEMFFYGFKPKKTDKIDSFIIIGCESDELYESDNLFNFWSNNFINKEKKREIST